MFAGFGATKDQTDPDCRAHKQRIDSSADHPATSPDSTSKGEHQSSATSQSSTLNGPNKMSDYDDFNSDEDDDEASMYGNKNSNTVSVGAPSVGSTTTCGGIACVPPVRQGVARGAPSVGCNNPRGGVTPADLPTVGRGIGRGIAVFNHGERLDEKHCRFPRQFPSNVPNSTRPGPSGSFAQPAMTQTRETFTSAAYSTQKPPKVMDHGVGSGNTDLCDVVQNNPNVSAAWLKQTLSTEQEARKKTARNVPVGSKEVYCFLFSLPSACVIFC